MKDKFLKTLGAYIAICFIIISAMLMTGVAICLAKGIKWLIINF